MKLYFIIFSSVATVAIAKSSFRRGTTTQLAEDEAFWNRVLADEESYQPAPVSLTASPSVFYDPASATPIAAIPSPIISGPVADSPVMKPSSNLSESPTSPGSISPISPGSPVTAPVITKAPVIPVNPLTPAPIIPAPNTGAPVANPTTATPGSSAPIIIPPPVTGMPVPVPTTTAPVTAAPVVTPAPVTNAPIPVPTTTAPISTAPVVTPSPVTNAPIPVPTTVAPTTTAPVLTPSPITNAPIPVPTTVAPTTTAPVLTPSPVTSAPIPVPTTAAPTTAAPNTPSPIVIITPAPVSSVRTLIKTVALKGGAEFDNPTSYQSKALEWLELNTLTSTLSDERIIQRYALACIWFGSNGVRTLYSDGKYGADVAVPGWISTSNWLGAVTECTWFGIICENDFVTQIKLYSNRLTGSFAPETQLLASTLTYIDLFDNAVWNPGAEYNDFLGKLTNLENLYYGSTNFEYDGIPTAIGQLSKLVEYDASFTLYFGAIPGSIFNNLLSMEYLVLGGNAYNSTVPIEISRLPKLEYFYIEESFLEGDLSFLEPMKIIYEVWAQNNPGLKGTIPTFIGSLTTLHGFRVNDCSLTGTIPSEIGNLVSMERLWVAGNKLTGTVPSEIGLLKRMEKFELQSNEISGTMPTEICANRDPIGLLTELPSDCLSELVCTCCTACS